MAEDTLKQAFLRSEEPEILSGSFVLLDATSGLKPHLIGKTGVRYSTLLGDQVTIL